MIKKKLLKIIFSGEIKTEEDIITFMNNIKNFLGKEI